VLEMSRFLLRTKVAGRSLAAQILARVLERLPDDFESLYGYRPLLVETVVRKDGQEASGRVSEALEGVFPEGTKALPGPEKTVYLTPLPPRLPGGDGAFAGVDLLFGDCRRSGSLGVGVERVRRSGDGRCSALEST
jgi:hypothetical protein